MSNNVGDMVRMHKNQGHIFMIVDLEPTGAGGHMFHLYNFQTLDVQKWFEPFDQCLPSRYWETLA